MSTETTGRKLRRIREKEELKLIKVSVLLSIDVAVLSKMDRGERKMSRDIVLKLANIYNYNADELLVTFISDKILMKFKMMSMA